MKNKRIGTFTLGASLILLGCVFALRALGLSLSYELILSFWPVILIMLGVEVLLCSFANKEDKLRYDGTAIFLLIVLTFFSMAMAGAEFILSNHLYDIALR